MKIGEKIRELRLQLSLTQEELADRCELTKGFISQVENDLTSPSIATLVDILDALGTSLKEFFDEEEEQKVVYKPSDFIEKNSEEMDFLWLVPSAQKYRMEPCLVTLKAGQKTGEDIPHEGEEFGYVLQGSIRVILGKKKYVCKKGESFYFVADKVHCIESGDKEAKFMWISSPPNF